MPAVSFINISPGPDNLMVLSLVMSIGRKHEMVFGLGRALGCLSHTLLAVVGVSSFLVASPLAFAALRSRGGATTPTHVADAPEQSVMQLLWRGVFASAINPK